MTAGAAWDEPGNLVTAYTLFTNAFHLNEPWIISRPDGTIEVFQYGALGLTATNTVAVGHPDGTGTNIDVGKITLLVHGATGQLLSTTTTDVQSGRIIDREVNEYDSLNRLTKTNYLDGTSLQQAYNCCGVSSRTNRDGTVATFTYYALKRLATTTLNSIITSNTYNAAGDITGVYRIGTDGTVVTNRQSLFNDAGDLVASFDPLNHPTLYTNYLTADGLLIRKTTYADASTRIETYGRDGNLRSLTGTAIQPLRYEQDATAAGSARKTIVLDANGNDTSEWA